MKKQIIKSTRARHLCTPSELGLTYGKLEHGRKYDIATCDSSRGKLLITWGLNLSKADLKKGNYYVYMGKVFDPAGTRDNYEMILKG